MVRNRIKKGVTLVEVLLASALIVLLGLGIVTAMSFSIESSSRSNQSSYAQFLAKEGIEAIRNIRNTDLSNLTNGTYGLVLSGNQWTLSGSSDTTNSLYTRQVNISTINATTKRVTVTVSWNGRQVTQFSDFTTWQENVPIPSDLGLLVYGDNIGDDDVIRFKKLDSNGNWSTEKTVPDLVPLAQPQLRNLKLYGKPSSNEKILIAKFVLSPNTSVYGIVWDGDSWGNPQLLTSYASTTGPEYQSYDGDFTSTGDFYLIYNDNTTTPKYRIWNGSTWGTQLSTVNVGGVPAWIKAKTQPSTNNILVAVHDTSNDVNTTLWNGSTWSTAVEHNTNTTGATFDGVDLIWSRTNTNIALLTYTASGSNNPSLRSWNGSVWSSITSNTNIGGQGRAVRFASSPTLNQNLACFVDNLADINCLTTSATTLNWSFTMPGEIEDNTDSGGQRSFDFAYEQTSGQRVPIRYNGNPTTTVINSRDFNPSINSWSSEVVGSVTTGQIETVRAVPRANSDDVLFLYGITDQDVYTEVWNGSTNTMYSTGGRALTEHGLFGSNNLDYWFDFAWNYATQGPSTIALEQSFMSIGSTYVTNQTATFSDSVTVGNAVVVSISSYRNAQDCPMNTGTVTDNKGNTYNFVNEISTTNMCISVFYTIANTGGTNFIVTVDPPGSNQYWMTIALHEYRGISATSTVNQSLNTSGTGSLVNTGNLPTTTTPKTLIFSTFTYTGTSQIEATPGTNFRMKSYFPSGTRLAHFSEDRIVSTTGNYSGNINFASSVTWRGVVVAFRGI